jgi:hypothetical protein
LLQRLSDSSQICPSDRLSAWPSLWRACRFLQGLADLVAALPILGGSVSRLPQAPRLIDVFVSPGRSSALDREGTGPGQLTVIIRAATLAGAAAGTTP